MSTHGPIQKEYRASMNKLAKRLDKWLGGLGFALLVFKFGEPDRCNYISNAKREDMLIAMKEFIARAEGMDHPGSKASH